MDCVGIFKVLVFISDVSIIINISININIRRLCVSENSCDINISFSVFF